MRSRELRRDSLSDVTEDAVTGRVRYSRSASSLFDPCSVSSWSSSELVRPGLLSDSRLRDLSLAAWAESKSSLRRRP